MNNKEKSMSVRACVSRLLRGLLLTLIGVSAHGETVGGAPKRRAPGFPDDGNWNVRLEGLNVAP